MKFRPITEHDFSTLQPYFESQSHPLCVYSLASIIAWRNDCYQPYGAVTDDALIIRAEFKLPNKKHHLILPMSPSGDYTPEELRDLAMELGFEQYWHIPQSYIEKFGRQQISHCFEIVEQPDYHDYVYHTSDLAHLKGNKYSKKRNLINQFTGRYVDKGRVTIENITPALLDESTVFLKAWCREHGCEEEDKEHELMCERQAILNSIAHIDLLQMQGIVLRIDNQMNALGISSHLTQDMAVLHFEKAFAQVKGLYQYFDRECARRLFNGYQYLNKESDMGLPGLAKAKKSYHPVFSVKSYQLILRC